MRLTSNSPKKGTITSYLSVFFGHYLTYPYSFLPLQAQIRRKEDFIAQ